MAFSLRIFSSDTSLRPGLACEITPEGVIAARQAAGEQAVMAFAPLAAGAVRPGLAEANFADRPVVATALRQAIDKVSEREKQLTLVVPDASVRSVDSRFRFAPFQTAGGDADCAVPAEEACSI